MYQKLDKRANFHQTTSKTGYHTFEKTPFLTYKRLLKTWPKAHFQGWDIFQVTFLSMMNAAMKN